MSYDELRLYAEMFTDVQEFRKSAANKVRSATVDATFVGQAIDQYEQSEHLLSLALRRCMRQTVAPAILAWQKENAGIGEHLLGRLLGIVGDPRWAEPKHWEGAGESRKLIDDDPRPRTVSQLWSYCGHGDPSRKRSRGMSAEDGAALGNPAAKSIVWNLADSCVKAGVRYLCDDGEVSKRNAQHLCSRCGLHKKEHVCKAVSHYGAVYLDRRVRTEDRQHAGPCIRCGPGGKPAQPGSPWSAAHQHADALRILGKEILRDLWLAGGGHGSVSTHHAGAVSSEPASGAITDAPVQSDFAPDAISPPAEPVRTASTRPGFPPYPGASADGTVDTGNRVARPAGDIGGPA